MPTSAPGSRRIGRVQRIWQNRRPAPQAGFTLVELLIVIAIVALGVGLVALALPDGDSARLEEEGERLVTLLETARAESRVSGAAVWWVPRGAAEGFKDEAGARVNFRFVGVPPKLGLPNRWLDERVSAEVVGARQLVLGPAAILPPQRVVLSLGNQRLELASDGLGAFSTATPARAPP